MKGIWHSQAIWKEERRSPFVTEKAVPLFFPFKFWQHFHLIPSDFKNYFFPFISLAPVMSVGALRALDWTWHRTALREEVLGCSTGTLFQLLSHGSEHSTGCGRLAFTFLFLQWDSSPHIFQDPQEEILTTYLCSGWRMGSPSLHGSCRDLEEGGNRKKGNICVCVWVVCSHKKRNLP